MPVRARERPYDDQLLQIPSFAGLVVLAGSLNPIPSRTRPLNFPAPMVVRLKTRESRSLPGLPRTEFPLHVFDTKSRRGFLRGGFLRSGVATLPGAWAGTERFASLAVAPYASGEGRLV